MAVSGISGISGQIGAPAAVPQNMEEAQEIRTGNKEETAAQPMREAELSRGLGTVIDTQA